MSVTAFGIEKEALGGLLDGAEDGSSRLPDFQRGWIWDDERVRSLLASISLGYPIGAVMMLRAGGETIRFKQRPLEGAPPASKEAERLILDGQQRLTSLFQSLRLDRPVLTKDHGGREIERWYYINIREALDENTDREEAIVSLPGNRQVRKFGRDIVEDYSTPALEYEAMLFPLSRVFNCMEWRRGFFEFWEYDKDKIQLWDRFEMEVVKRFEQYQVPVIELGKDTPKEAVCQVFEKVNTGGVTLTVFELLTATFAADDFPLRQDWEKREREIHAHPVLAGVSNTDFIQAVTLLATRDRKEAFVRNRGDDDRAPGIGCKRSDMLGLERDEYEKWAAPLVEGFEKAARFLHSQTVYEERFLPYGSQLIPLAAILTILGPDWEPQRAKEKLAQWYWCGVLGELYGGSTDTRFSRDLPEVLAWIGGTGPEPRTVYDAQFASSRLLTLRTRRSAAYKGLYALLLREGACDWRTGEEATIQNYFDESIDIHHVFPQRWCKDEKNRIDPARCDSIVNKTPLTARTNRIIGGDAPSRYVPRLSEDFTDRHSLDRHIQSHMIDPDHLRADDFDGFFNARRSAFLRTIESVMGKQISDDIEELDDTPAEYERVQEDAHFV